MYIDFCLPMAMYHPASTLPLLLFCQQTNTIAKIRHSAAEGHTVLLCQTDNIHECFYDLFNQRFRCIQYYGQPPLFYANIAIGAYSKLSRVHPKFQCIVILKKSEVMSTPAPFLNRFEKYQLSHKTLLDIAFSHLPPRMEIVIRTAYWKVS